MRVTVGWNDSGLQSPWMFPLTVGVVLSDIWTALPNNFRLLAQQLQNRIDDGEEFRLEVAHSSMSKHIKHYQAANYYCMLVWYMTSLKNNQPIGAS